MLHFGMSERERKKRYFLTMMILILAELYELMKKCEINKL